MARTKQSIRKSKVEKAPRAHLTSKPIKNLDDRETGMKQDSLPGIPTPSIIPSTAQSPTQATMTASSEPASFSIDQPSKLAQLPPEILTLIAKNLLHGPKGMYSGQDSLAMLNTTCKTIRQYTLPVLCQKIVALKPPNEVCNAYNAYAKGFCHIWKYQDRAFYPSKRYSVAGINTVSAFLIRDRSRRGQHGLIVDLRLPTPKHIAAVAELVNEVREYYETMIRQKRARPEFELPVLEVRVVEVGETVSRQDIAKLKAKITRKNEYIVPKHIAVLFKGDLKNGNIDRILGATDVMCKPSNAARFVYLDDGDYDPCKVFSRLANAQTSPIDKLNIRIRQTGIYCKGSPYEECGTSSVTKYMKKRGVSSLKGRIGVGCGHVFAFEWNEHGGGSSGMGYDADDFDDLWEDEEEDGWDWSDDGGENEDEEDGVRYGFGTG